VAIKFCKIRVNPWFHSELSILPARREPVGTPYESTNWKTNLAPLRLGGIPKIFSNTSKIPLDIKLISLYDNYQTKYRFNMTNKMRKKTDKMNHKFEIHKSAIGNRKSQIFSPIYSYTHPPIHSFMQNKPNFTPIASTKHANGADFTPNFGIYPPRADLFYPPKAAFPQKYTKKHALFPNFYAKRNQFFQDFIRVYPDPSGARRDSFVRNKPNPASTTQRRKNAKRTQSQQDRDGWQRLYEGKAMDTTSERRDYAKQTQFTHLRHENSLGSCVLGSVSFQLFYAKQTQLQSIHSSNHLPIHSSTQLCKIHPS
jgi:hypothetical protein